MIMDEIEWSSLTSVALAPSTPTSVAKFQSICAAEGQQARCCVIPVVSLPSSESLAAANHLKPGIWPGNILRSTLGDSMAQFAFTDVM